MERLENTGSVKIPRFLFHHIASLRPSEAAVYIDENFESLIIAGYCESIIIETYSILTSSLDEILDEIERLYKQYLFHCGVAIVYKFNRGDIVELTRITEFFNKEEAKRRFWFT